MNSSVEIVKLGEVRVNTQVLGATSWKNKMKSIMCQNSENNSPVLSGIFQAAFAAFYFRLGTMREAYF